MEEVPTVKRNVFLFVPNLIGYVRLILLALAWYLKTNPPKFIFFYLLSIILDGVDGIAARKLNQTSAFGAWLDVAVDNLGRGMLWTLLFRWGYFISALEWLVFVATHSSGEAWKTAPPDPPGLVKAVMANGFKTPIGAFAIAGLHLLPVWFYYLEYFNSSMELLITLILIAGRALCATVELWFLSDHIRRLAAKESD